MRPARNGQIPDGIDERDAKASLSWFPFRFTGGWTFSPHLLTYSLASNLAKFPGQSSISRSAVTNW